MRALLQRVTSAKVEVNHQTISEINAGILVYLGIGTTDEFAQGKALIDKLLTYRVFEDDDGKLSLNVQQINGSVLLVSQFTLMATTNKGLRPDFKPAMAYADAENMYHQLVDYAKKQYPKVATGEFGADMQVSSINDGPINFILEK